LWGITGQCGFWGVPLVSYAVALSLEWKDEDGVAVITILGCSSRPPPCWIRCTCFAPEILTIQSQREKSVLLKEPEGYTFHRPSLRLDFLRVSFGASPINSSPSGSNLCICLFRRYPRYPTQRSYRIVYFSGVASTQ
jgi:hypothetical protein